MGRGQKPSRRRNALANGAGEQRLPAGLGATLSAQAQGMAPQTLRFSLALNEDDLERNPTRTLPWPEFSARLLLGPPAIRVQMHIFGDRDKVLHAEPLFSQLREHAKLRPAGAPLEAKILSFDGVTVELELELNPLDLV